MTATTDLLTGRDNVLDVRTTPCAVKHGLILQTFVNLPVDDHFVLRNGHDPLPLRYQLEAEFPGAFTWEYVHHRPEDVAIKITKLKALGACQDLPHCCGH